MSGFVNRTFFMLGTLSLITSRNRNRPEHG